MVLNIFDDALVLDLTELLEKGGGGDGWACRKEVLERIYAPAAFFHRLTIVGQMLRRPALSVRPSRAAVTKDLATLARVAWRMTIHKPALAHRFWRLLLSCACTNPRALEYIVNMIVIFLHVGPFAAHVIADLETQIAAIDRGERPEP